MRKKATKVVEKPLAPQIEQLASFDLTVITSVSSGDDVEGQKKVGISIVPYIEDGEEALFKRSKSLGHPRFGVAGSSVPCRTDQIRKSIRQVVMHPT
eukprot:scaffold9118_cov139-Skeletonema_dohrnii-CCMP3373.AAC.7